MVQQHLGQVLGQRDQQLDAAEGIEQPKHRGWADDKEPEAPQKGARSCGADEQEAGAPHITQQASVHAVLGQGQRGHRCGVNGKGHVIQPDRAVRPVLGPAQHAQRVAATSSGSKVPAPLRWRTCKGSARLG